MNKILIVILFAIILVGIDLYVFQAVRVLTDSLSVVPRRIIHGIYWGVTVVVLSCYFLYHFSNPDAYSRVVRSFLLTGVFMNYFAKLFGIVFLLIDDGIRLGKWVMAKFSSSETQHAVTEAGEKLQQKSSGISRSEFLSRTAVVAAGAPMVGMAYGILSGAHDYRIRRLTVSLPNLPQTFDGIKIGQLSDIHSGSFFNKTAVKGGVEMLANEKPDMIFFTGDLVNNEAKEVEDYIGLFGKLSAPLGIYSTLGNHDYGDYKDWKTPQAKIKNLENLMKAHKLMGWDLLNNENRIITQSGEKLAIIGVENWGKGRFKKKGDLAAAHQGTEEAAVKLLLSHDPSHWDAQVREYKDIDLMFAGHTHGFQFGVEVGDFQWSPSQYVYEQWAGLYQKENQYLYVNRGFGYLGFPGRVGMPPEITIVELKKA